MRPKTSSLFAVLLFFIGATTTAAADTALEVFEQRLMPIFRSPEPSSCVQCHLSSVDLKDYILPSHEKTFVSLRDRGLINLEKPDESKILTLIRMGEKDLDKRAKLIHEDTRRAEFDAFAGWVKACCSDPKLRELPPLDGIGDLKIDTADEVIRYNRKDRVLDSFVRNVWSQRMRCFPCHTPNELDSTNPLHAKPIANSRELQQKFGAKMNLFLETPQETMAAWIQSSRRKTKTHLPLINFEEPRKSLLVLKPTSKLPAKDADGQFEKPSSLEPVSHMGGLKMHVGDQSYKSFMAWIQDYGRVVDGKYDSVERLPRDNWFPSQHVLRLSETPPSWETSTCVQLFVHSWNDENHSWNSEPIAFTQGIVTPKRFVNGTLFLLAPPKEPRSPSWDPQGAALKPGKYLIKVHADTKHRLNNDPTLMLNSERPYGQVEIQARWRNGFPEAEVVSARNVVTE